MTGETRGAHEALSRPCAVGPIVVANTSGPPQSKEGSR
jgi:hypothetical protein